MKNKKSSNLKRFRLKDNYLRFYIKYIQPNKEKIARGLFHFGSFADLPGHEIILGLQFGNLVLNNLKTLCEHLNINFTEVVMAGSFFQKKTQRQKGCQIDLLIQTKFQILYACEIKFHSKEIKTSIINEVQENVQKSGFFSHILDFSELFKSEN